MKLIHSILIPAILLAIKVDAAYGQDSTGHGKTMPAIKVQNLEGKEVDVSKIRNDGKPFVFSFWATWCGPCIKELNTLADLYEEWQENYGVIIYAVSIDDSRSSSKIKPFVEGKRWEYEMLVDPNQDLMRAAGFSHPPFTVLMNGNGEIVWTHNSYIDGDEYELEKKIADLVKK